ncbi:MAG: RNA-directed DNA polymerase [Candidatus Jorgensenbacteria bacterium GW2011_GWA2_45_13]|uniref:RNA-directed DNA polymerase n=1 Tax=Candidatus Jorgensenbacteria bacterium GW2011_GWA2_45_13 TaxID=1618662 RepID=A0A0G1L691_9BACT|nr:MAG: RNA-directed DNA polymerase [Candidatus Jorgensenbacteria bacterium GW2011_GWA2_45_13]
MLLSILRKRIKDEDLMRLICLILANHKTSTSGKGMPLGNLTSQFFANVYLAELDNFVKHVLKAKYYIRYVDDFVILHRSKEQLADWQVKINLFLSEKLKIELHQDKTKIIPLRNGVPLVGFRIFHICRLLKKSNLRKMQKRLSGFRVKFTRGEVTKEHILLSVAGWGGYARMGNTYRLQMKVRKEAEEILEKCKPEKS